MSAVNDQPDPVGPWEFKIDETEKVARFRALAALGVVFLGADHPLVAACLEAETGLPDKAAAAWHALQQIEPLPRRRLLSVYAALSSAMRAREWAR